MRIDFNMIAGDKTKEFSYENIKSLMVREKCGPLLQISLPKGKRIVVDYFRKSMNVELSADGLEIKPDETEDLLPQEIEETPLPVVGFHTEGKSDGNNNNGVDHPQYYNKGKVECIDAIESAIKGLSGEDAFLTGQVIKYLYRWKDKGGKQDLRKAEWYLRRLIGDDDQ